MARARRDAEIQAYDEQQKRFWPVGVSFIITLERPRFWTRPPGTAGSRPVRRTEVDIDLESTFVILETVGKYFRGHWWVSVRFAYQGREVWTNVRRDWTRRAWMV